MVLPIAEEKSLIKPEEKHAAVLTLIWGGKKEVKLNGSAENYWEQVRTR